MKKRKAVAICASCLVLTLALSSVAAVAAQNNNGRANPANINAAELGTLTGTMQMDGQSWVYRDGSWSTEQEYQPAHPNGDSSCEFWNVDEFAAWVEQQRTENQKLADSSDMSFYYKPAGKNSDGAFRAWTQDDVNAQYAQWQEQLKQMEQGYQYTKPIILDNGAFLAGTFEPNPESATALGSTVITLPDNSEIDLGHFDTANQATNAVKEHLDQQVKAGKLTQSEANQIVKNGSIEGEPSNGN